MSGRTPIGPAPFIAPTSGDIDQRLALMASMMSRKANMTDQPTYAAVLLIAPDGSTWKLTVNATGALSTAQVVR
jgi:hypothetical protein